MSYHYCRQGHVNPPEARFCGTCGEPVPAAQVTGAPPSVFLPSFGAAAPPLPAGHVLVAGYPVAAAGYWQRGLANSIDATLVMLAVLLISAVFGVVSPDLGAWVALLLCCGGVPWWVATSWARTGQTPGKRWMGIRVVRADGQPMTTGDAVKRLGLAAFLSLITGGFSYLRLAWHERRQASHDVYCGTYVIKVR